MGGDQEDIAEDYPDYPLLSQVPFGLIGPFLGGFHDLGLERPRPKRILSSQEAHLMRPITNLSPFLIVQMECMTGYSKNSDC